MSKNAEKLIEQEPKLINETTTYCSFDKNFQNDWQNLVKNTLSPSDPTCGGILAEVSFEPESQSASEPSPTEFYPGLRVPGLDNMIDKAINMAKTMAPDKVLEQKVDQLIKDFGSRDFKVRDAAEKAAKKLPVEAIPLLKKGLQSGSPEVQDRTERSIFGIKMAHLEKCLKPVMEIFKDLDDLHFDFGKKLTPETRKKWEDKIKKADDLELTKEDIDLAIEFHESLNKDENIEKMFETSRLRESLETKGTLRILYAEKLARTKDPEDRKLAIKLLKEAFKTEGWKDTPGYVTGAVEELGDVDNLPDEIKDAYKISLEKVKENDKKWREEERRQGRMRNPW